MKNLNKEKQYQLSKTHKYHPVSRKRHSPNKQQLNHNSPVNGSFFHGNLAQNMRFGGKDHDLSGFVQRTVVMKDRIGNVQIAKEQQFFNSSKNGMRVRINNNEKE